MTDMADVHDLPAQAFLEEVHSFDFWFQSVEGYLSGLTFGHRPETREKELRMAKIFLSTQVADEGRHLEVFLHRLRDLGVIDPEMEIECRASRSLLLFKRRLLELVAGKDWEAAIFAQNVILEALEYAVFHAHSQDADPITAEVLRGVIKDERRHIGFGENEIGRRLAASPHIRARLGQVKKELDHLVLDTLEETQRQIGLARSEEDKLGRAYLESVERLGFAA